MCCCGCVVIVFFCLGRLRVCVVCSLLRVLGILWDWGFLGVVGAVFLVVVWSFFCVAPLLAGFFGVVCCLCVWLVVLFFVDVTELLSASIACWISVILEVCLVTICGAS